ncbi:unnamed protein product [Rhizophagus irregularis]|nr:unnamed protein product [Rhizophagus irregularis]
MKTKKAHRYERYEKESEERSRAHLQSSLLSTILISSDLQTLHNNFHIAPLYRYNIPKVMDYFLNIKGKLMLQSKCPILADSGLPVVICSNILRYSSTRGSDQQIQSLIRQRRLRISLSDS